MDRTYRSPALARTLLLAMAPVLAGCDSLMEVTLPGAVTEDTFYSPSNSQVLIDSQIAHFECAFSEFVASAKGYEDVGMHIGSHLHGHYSFSPTVPGGSCNPGSTGLAWYSTLQTSRQFGEEAYRLISEEWNPSEIVGNRDQLLIQAAIYAGAAYELLGEHVCEVAVEGGPLMSPDQTLAVAEEWLTKALGHIGTTGDFALPRGGSSSAKQLAHLLRARVRFARGNNAGAAADAREIQQGFKAWVVRDDIGERRRWNRLVNIRQEALTSVTQGPVTWYVGGPPNPVTGQPWPNPIPFTGYRDLAVAADGRAITDAGYPITTATAGAILDPRVPIVDEKRLFNSEPVFRQGKYETLDADIPMANWEEAWIILAKVEGGQQAINWINQIRSFHGLPLVSYVDPSNAQQVRYMILEDERRSLFLEGRWWSTKIQNVDVLWFPRRFGTTPFGRDLGGAVRLVMSESEFDINQNFDETSRNTLCNVHERPII